MTSPVQVLELPAAQWPPRPGEVWVDWWGHRWFAVADRDGAVDHMVSSFGMPLSPGQVQRDCGPLRLVSREADAVVA